MQDPAAESAGTAEAVPSDFRGAVAAFERKMLEQALAACRHNQRKAAQLLGLSYDQLRHAMKRHKLLAAEP
jgi:psp operon transcriptional activator